jgi:hypothetical protein
MHKQDQLTFFYKKSPNYYNYFFLYDISITIGHVKCDGLQWNQLQQHKRPLWLNWGYTNNSYHTEDVDVHRDLDLSFTPVNSW